MNEDRYGSGKKSQVWISHCNSDDKFQYLLSAEEQLLRSISARAPLPELLNGICNALDCQIGNVVSNISLPDDDASELAAIAEEAAFFGLSTFCSSGVVAENGALLGSLEMYCCPRRNPSVSESQLIERAMCLAAIAIQLDTEGVRKGNCGMRGNSLVRGRVTEWPVSIN